MSNTEPATVDGDGRTDPCRKCTTQVPPDASRCPHCGFDATPGTLATVAYWVLIAPQLLGVAALALVAFVGALASALTVGELLGVWLGCAILGAMPAIVTVWYWRARKRTVGGV
jgi:hypothetical protein